MKWIKPTPVTGRVNTTRLVELVAADLGRSHGEVREVVMATFNVIMRALASRCDVAVTNFGTFRAVRTKDRLARNPQTGEMVHVPAAWLPHFRPTRPLTEAVRLGDSEATVNKAPKTPRPEQSAPSDD